MLYEYSHPQSSKGCPTRFEFFKLAQDSNRRENCPYCNRVLERVFSVPTPLIFKPFYHARYRKVINSEREYQRELRKRNEVEGHELIRSNPEAMSRIKESRKKYKSGRVGRKAGDILTPSV